MIRLAAALLLIGTGVAGSAQRPASAPLAFRIDEGRNINAFFRQGPIAAHLLLRAGTDPRILVGFPAGNSGVALWFEKTARPVTWTLDAPPRVWPAGDARGRPLRGIRASVSVDARELRFRQGLGTSIRILRDYELLRRAPAEVIVAPRLLGGMHGGGASVTWARDRLDGAPGYLLQIIGRGDTVVTESGITAGTSGRISIDVVAQTGETPLTPLAGAALLNDRARDDQRTRNALQFLSYGEKYLAGSWRFDTYFGRDTLMSLRLLMPVLQPAAVEDGLSSVLVRLAANGEVAHEEDIGEFAVLRNAREGRGRTDAPIYDYAMVDDDFMLAPVARAWLLERGRPRAAAFLASRTAGGERRGDLLARNFAWVVGRTAAFAADPGYRRLVAIKDGRLTGQWRDSEEGLGRGRYAYDVNAVWVPAALGAIGELAPLLRPYGTQAERAAIARAAAQAQVWTRAAPPLFALTLPAAEAREDVRRYAAKVGVPAAPALAALGTAPLSFNALSLDAAGRPVPVVHSDDGFALLFTRPDAGSLDRSVEAIARPFPAGLMTDVGLLVANPAYASAEVQGRFGANAYHGTVVWSWQQAILAAGLDRQLARADLPAATRARLVALRTRLWRAIGAAGEVRTSELWSWAYADGRYRVAPFGASGADVDESNAAQLWSTVFLALRPPTQ
ncbi:hypothetical protein [Sphingomonas rubra]|uniref:Lipoprotein n=1 Tax=Sphingomonas rubra TaxID=634430 RepID=A0A1I5RG02_9SPHN|nr:hypothetical protein [Sphingomonas rubra]SFP57300.1 hypothetical protein SAMN04488241_103227 [Sphingomonas rubra]